MVVYFIHLIGDYKLIFNNKLLQNKLLYGEYSQKTL